MKLTILLSVFFVFNSLANGYSQNKQLSLNLKQGSLVEALESIEKQSDYFFFYKNNDLKDVKCGKINFQNASINDVLDKILSDKKFSYKVVDNYVAITKGATNAQSQEGNREIKGKVVDAAGEPIPGVSVIAKGTTIGMVTDLDGKYTLNVPEDSKIIVFSFVGMKSQEVEYTGQTTLDITLQEDAIGLEEVVAVGYGIKKKSDLTGAVNTLKAEDLNKGVINSPQQMLQGNVAGLQINSPSGEPGAAMEISIRGVNSINSGSEPLYVVDGVPLSGASTSGGGGVGHLGGSKAKNPLNFLNPSDIKNITVLKDASATAIYGTRASNGVILIETKRGNEGKGSISYDTYVSVSNISKKLDLLNAEEYKRETARLGAILERDPNSYIQDPNLDMDWQDELFRTAISQNHNLSFTGSTEKSSYNASISYMNQQGIVQETDHTKYTGRLNINHKAFNDRLKIQFNLTYADMNDNGQALGGGSTATGNLMTTMLVANPTAPKYLENGKINPTTGAADNPFIYIENYKDVTETQRVLGNFTTIFTLLKGLDYKLNIGYEGLNARRSVRLNPGASDSTPEGTVRIRYNQNKNVLVENYLTYNHKFENTFSLSGLLGQSYQTFNDYGNTIQTNDFTTDEIDPIYNPGVGSVIKDYSGWKNVRKLQSFFGRVNLGYKDRYLLTASLRADGSSVFGKNNRYGYFPSFAAAWRLSEEDFLKDSSFINNLKLRLGWGQTGNQNIPTKVTQASLTSSKWSGFTFVEGTHTNGISLSRAANPDLKWETTTQVNAGLDFAFADGVLTGAVDYFSKTTSDLFMYLTTQAPSPVGKAYTNVDTEIQNKGLELELSARVIKQKDIDFSVGANFSTIKNEVTKLPSSIELGMISGPGLTGEYISIYKNGNSIGSFYMKRFLGFDENGNGTYSDQKEIVGDALPDFTYGLNLNFRYKRFNLNTNFSGVGGVDIFNNTARAYFSAATLGQNGANISKHYLNAVENPTVAPKTSDYYLESGDYFRLNNATISYSVDVSSIAWIRSLSVNVTGQNLFTITNYSGYAPDSNTNGTNLGIDYATYPKARTFLLGLNVKF